MSAAYITTRKQLEMHCESLLAKYPEGSDFPEFGLHLKEETGKRTLKQNSAIHKYYALLSEELNNAGLDMVAVLREGADIPWTPANVKERLWKPVQEAAIGTVSTTKLDRKQVSHVYEILTRHLGQKFGVSVPFPQRDYG